MIQRSPFTSLFCIAALMGIAIISPTDVHAKDMRGKLGIGANTTLTGAHGLTVRYWPNRSLGIEIMGGAIIAGGSSDGDRINVVFAAQISYVLREIGRANLLFGVRGIIAYVNDEAISGATETPTSTNSYLHPAIEAPFTIEYYFSDSFSLQLAAGLAISFIPKEGSLLPGGQLFGDITTSHSDRDFDTIMGLGSGGLFGSAGFTFYF
jgi:hypothetical protein